MMPLSVDGEFGPQTDPERQSNALCFKGKDQRESTWRKRRNMSEGVQVVTAPGWRARLSMRVAELRRREGQIFLVLALVIGALTGLAVVAFILLTEHMGMRLYPVGGARWRRGVFPVAGSLSIGYLL